MAVLDWELSTLGHPLADLGYNCMMYHFGEGFGASGGCAGLDLKAFGIPSEPEYLAAYARRTGRKEVPSFEFYLAFSLFRLAAIVQGVYKRGLDGNASSETATKYGNRAKALADMAWAMVGEEGLGVGGRATPAARHVFLDLSADPARFMIMSAQDARGPEEHETTRHWRGREAIVCRLG